MAKVIRRTGDGAAKLEMLLTSLGKHRARVGWLESAKYPNGESVGGIAAVHEFGNPMQGIPPRPFMRPTIENERLNWAKLAEKAYKATGSEYEAMEMLGLKAAGDIAKTISKIQSPPLDEKTVKARQRGYADKNTVGSLTKPLVHTGILFNSLTHVVEDK